MTIADPSNSNRKCLKNVKNYRKNHFESIWTTHDYLKRQNLTKYGSNTFKMIISLIFSNFQTFSVWITLIKAAPSPRNSRALCPVIRVPYFELAGFWLWNWVLLFGVTHWILPQEDGGNQILLLGGVEIFMVDGGERQIRGFRKFNEKCGKKVR